jgi:hypothetical protein
MDKIERRKDVVIEFPKENKKKRGRMISST